MAVYKRSSSVMLLSVIRTLSNSDDVERREIERERLQHELSECDEKLDRLVEENQDHLKSTIQTFNGMSTKIAASLKKVKELKENLNACKSLLHCKRDELRKFWMEGMEQSEVLNLLDQIDQVKNVPEQIEKYKKKKYYLHATESLVSTVNLLEGTLSGVEALRHLRLDLQAKKQVEHELLIRELNIHLYMKTEKCREARKRLLEGLDETRRDATSGVRVQVENFQKNHQRSASRSLMMEHALMDSAGSVKSDSEVREDLYTDPEEDSDHFMILLVESLSLLGKIPEAIEAIKKRMKIEMSLIIHRATTIVARRAGQSEDTITQQNQPHLLLELLEVVFDMFRGVAHAHQIVLSAIHKIVQKDTQTDFGDTNIYAIDVVWSEVQFAIQMLLGDYLDVKNMASAQQAPSAFTESESDISSFFAPKRRGISRGEQAPSLYKFEGSSSAISMNAYIRERRQECMEGTANEEDDDAYGQPLHNTKPQLLCKPNPRNITVVFCPVMAFVDEVEAAITTQEGMRCTLYGFVTDYVKEIFIEEVKFQIKERLESVTKEDAFRKTTDSLEALGASRPLLQSTIIVENLIGDLKHLMHSLPNYSPQFLDMICKALSSYKESCNTAYRGLLRFSSDSERPTKIVSALWAKDEDISRLLRSLPNWQVLQQQPHRQRKGEDEDLEASRKRNERESEILTSNLGEHILAKAEVVLVVADLRTLANLQESSEWLAGHIRHFSTSLSGQSTAISLVTPDSKERLKTQEIPPVPPEILSSLDTLAQDFQHLAEMCLLVLHLEIRCHCFYFLLRVVRESNYYSNVSAMDPDDHVEQLNKDLASLEEIAAANLAQHKFRYLFEGLGHLIASILISNASEIKRFNQNGIKKMCRNVFAIQQNLTNITMSREGDLDRARQYYELLNIKPDGILNLIVEQGAKYTEMEYETLLTLEAKSQVVRDPAALQSRVHRLKEIMKELKNSGK